MNFHRSIIIAELWRPEVARRWKKFQFFAFFIKMTPYGKIFKILFQKDSSPHQTTCCVQILWNVDDGKSVKSCVAYLTKKHNFTWLSSSCYCADCAQNLPGPAWDNVLRLLQILFTSVHFSQSYIRMREHRHRAHSKVNPIFSWSWQNDKMLIEILTI